MAAPQGNRNATKSKPWAAALRRALARAHGTVDKGLDALADKVVAAAPTDAWARDEIANRLEGRPAQSLDITSDVTTREAREVSDEQLVDIATGSGSGASDAQEGAQNSVDLH